MTTAETPWNWITDRRLKSCSDIGCNFVLEVVRRLEQCGWNSRDIFGVHLSLEEAVVNAIKHGNREDPGKQVHVICKVAQDRFWILVEDEGPGFDPCKVPDCTLDENLDKPSGRGLMLMRNYMTAIEYNDQGNRVVMEKVLATES